MVKSEGGDSCGNSTSLETPQEVSFFRGGSSRARGKRPPIAIHNKQQRVLIEPKTKKQIVP
ncbi:hypothetical protein ACLIA0_11320 [Bacillaceae bacterium W0354]